MKSGLRDRNNPARSRSEVLGHHGVSMKSGLRDRNNLSYFSIPKAATFSSQ